MRTSIKKHPSPTLFNRERGCSHAKQSAIHYYEEKRPNLIHHSRECVSRKIICKAFRTAVSLLSGNYSFPESVGVARKTNHHSVVLVAATRSPLLTYRGERSLLSPKGKRDEIFTLCRNSSTSSQLSLDSTNLAQCSVGSAIGQLFLSPTSFVILNSLGSPL